MAPKRHCKIFWNTKSGGAIFEIIPELLEVEGRGSSPPTPSLLRRHCLSPQERLSPPTVEHCFNYSLQALNSRIGLLPIIRPVFYTSPGVATPGELPTYMSITDMTFCIAIK